MFKKLGTLENFNKAGQNRNKIIENILSLFFFWAE